LDKLRLFLVYKLVVLGLALVGISTFAHIWPMSLGHFIGLFFQWDAKHILRVARDGYLAGEPSIQIFPAFPMLIRAFHLVVPSWEVSAFLAAQLASFGAFYYFHKLANQKLEKREADVATVLFALFPTAYFLTAPYTEPLFCCFTFACVAYFNEERYEYSAAAALGAALTRFTGVLLAPAVVAAGLLAYKLLSRRQLLGYAGVAAAAATGFLVYLALNKALFGDWFYYTVAQAKFWGVHPSWPFKGAFEAIASWGARSPDQRMAIIILEIAFMLGAFAPLPSLAKRREALDFTYVALSCTLLVSLDFWLSRPRYVMPLYPMYLWAAPWFARSTMRLALYALASVGLFGMYWGAYMNAQWAF
jgi:hypothetical protein